MQIAPGVHRLVAGYANVYLCVEDEGLTLVDSGTPRQATKILNAIRSLGQEAGKLRRILITHADFDHVGSAAALQRMTNASVLASAATAAYLRLGRSSPHIQAPLGLLGNLFNRYEAVPDDALEILEDGRDVPVLGGLRVLPTPGHTPDHHAFHSVSRGVLFCGDALGVRSGQLNLPPAFITANRKAAKESARMLLTLAPAVFACGHGEPLASPDAHDLQLLGKTLSSD